MKDIESLQHIADSYFSAEITLRTISQALLSLPRRRSRDASGGCVEVGARARGGSGTAGAKKTPKHKPAQGVDGVPRHELPPGRHDAGARQRAPQARRPDPVEPAAARAQRELLALEGQGVLKTNCNVMVVLFKPYNGLAMKHIT